MAKKDLTSPSGSSNPIGPDILRLLLDYEEKTGALTWRQRPAFLFSSTDKMEVWNSRNSGKHAFTTENDRGYLVGHIVTNTHRKMYRAHRVIWALKTGNWPSDVIDHINGDILDNRIANLRSVSRAENARNLKRPVNNTSGHIGVYWRSIQGKWSAEIKVNRKTVHLGSFSGIEDAVAARKAAEIDHRYHPNHGR